MPHHDNSELSAFQLQVAVGSLLGDMSASRPKNGRNYHLACYHSEKQVGWLARKWEWLQPHARPIQYCGYTDKRDGKFRKGARFHTISAPCFTEIAETLYINGRKSIPDSIGKIFTHPVALACLICDDGWWDKAGIGIATKQFGYSENELLADALATNFKIRASVMRDAKYSHIRIPAQSIEEVFDLCKEYIPAMMYYKFGGGNYVTRLVGKINKECPVCHTVFQAYESSGQACCSKKCSSNYRIRGYATRTTRVVCPKCQQLFLQYTTRQKFCKNCTYKPYPDELCVICGNPVNETGRRACSKRCNVILGHRTRKANITH